MKKLMEGRVLEIHGLGEKPLTFTNVKNATINTREITFSGTYRDTYVKVDKLKPSGLLVLDVTGDIVEPDADVAPTPPTPPAPPAPTPPAPPAPTPPAPPAPTPPIEAHTKQELYNVVSKLYNEGKAVVEKGLMPLGYKTVLEVPDNEIDNVFNAILNAFSAESESM